MEDNFYFNYWLTVTHTYIYKLLYQEITSFAVKTHTDTYTYTHPPSPNFTEVPLIVYLELLHVSNGFKTALPLKSKLP